MWLGSFRRQGMLAHRPAPDPKWKLIISSFFILPCLLDCLICTRNVMPILLLLEMMGRWERYRDGWLKIGCRWGDSSWASSYLFFLPCAFAIFSFKFSVPLLRWNVVTVVCFFIFTFFPSLFQAPLTCIY